MIIDLILDRKDGYPYDAHEFYNEIRDYERLGIGVSDERISIAMDYGDNRDVQRVLCEYIHRNSYPKEIQDYVRSQVWVV